MSQSRRIASSIIVSGMNPQDLIGVLRSPRITLSNTPFGLPGGNKGTVRNPNFSLYFKKAVDWKGDVDAMPPGARSGLSRAISISQGARGVRGTAIDPRTGNLVPRKAVVQRERGGGGGGRLRGGFEA